MAGESKGYLAVPVTVTLTADEVMTLLVGMQCAVVAGRIPFEFTVDVAVKLGNDRDDWVWTVGQLALGRQHEGPRD